MAKLESKRLRAFAFAALLGGGASATLLIPSIAHAEPVTPTAKGIIGGALVGAELSTFGQAIFGVRSTTFYLVGAGVGAAAGGVGGYFIEQAVDDGHVPTYILAGGLALLIPALVVGLDATRYMPSEGAREDKPVDLPPSDPGKPGGSTVLGAEPQAPTPAPSVAPAPAPASPEPTPAPAPPPAGGGGGGGGGGNPAPRRAPMSLFDVHEGAFRLGMPVPEVRPVLGSVERARMGVENRGSELRFPIVRVAF